MQKENFYTTIKGGRNRIEKPVPAFFGNCFLPQDSYPSVLNDFLISVINKRKQVNLPG